MNDAPAVSLQHKLGAQTLTFLGYYISYISIYKNPTVSYIAMEEYFILEIYSIRTAYIRNMSVRDWIRIIYQ